MGLIEKVAHERVLQLRVPIELHRAGDVPLLIEQQIFVALDDPHFGILLVLGDPCGGDKHFGRSVLGHEPTRWVVRWRSALSLINGVAQPQSGGTIGVTWCLASCR